MSPVLPPKKTILEGPSGTASIHIHLRDEVSSSDISSDTNIAISPTSTSLSINDSASPLPEQTHPITIKEKDSGYAYVTLSVTLPYTTYARTVLLGDSFSTTNDLIPTTYAVSSSSENVKVQTPGVATGTIVGISIGLILGFGALLAVFYVYLLRARQAKRIRRRRRRSRRGSSATAEGAPPPPPPPDGPPGPGPGPFPPAA